MSNECRCCGGRCVATTPVELNRRDFLARVAAGTAALAAAGQMAWAQDGEKPPLAPPAPGDARSYPLTPARVYRGNHLDAVGMPVGGIGTGSVWLDGKGQLGVWQIFNNLSEPRIPDSFFAVRVKTGGGEAVARVLQTAAEGSLQPVESLDYEGSYPAVRLTFHDRRLPVEVRMEALNPMIPLDTANSSIPCGLFRLTAKNPGAAAAEVTFLAALQNAVGSGGAGGIQGVRLAGYGGNRNRVVRGKGRTAVAMDKSPDPVPSGPVKVRGRSGREVEGPEMLWIAGLADFNRERADSLARIAEEGGIVLADGVGKGFFETLAKLRAHRVDGTEAATRFEDFEAKSYEGWTIRGAAFGERPSRGTEAGQQQVTGFAGHGLVNTFQGGDGPQGTATSKTFTIQRRYVGFLIGGGAHAGKTCINLRVDGKVVRTATGKNREALEPASWDVADLAGKQAVIEIVDESSEGWGHINIDRILFSDVPPEPLLAQGTAVETAAKAIDLPFSAAQGATLDGDRPAIPTEHAPAGLKAVAGDWRPARYTRLTGFRSGERGYRALAATASGDPLVIEGPLGKGRIILALAPGLTWSWGSQLLAAARQVPLKPDERLVPRRSTPRWPCRWRSRPASRAR